VGGTGACAGESAHGSVLYVLVAETKGKICPGAQNHEDSLTSAVFGHLRYLPPQVFWPDLAEAAVNLSGTCLGDRLPLPIAEYRTLQTIFWPPTPHGEPDLALIFEAPDKAPLLLVCEIKLWAGKSGQVQPFGDPEHQSLDARVRLAVLLPTGRS